ncbi:MAG: S9 family peptidase [Flavobacteriaceae bacterium]|nr:S9 family peptidase [Flavobacteriaceae bacterium]
MKKILSIFLLLFVTIISAQEVKHLNLEDAVLGYYKGLYPERKSLQWMEGTDDYIVTEDDIVQVNYNLSKRPALFSLEDLQKAIPSLKRMPYSFEKVTSDVVIFSHNNAMVTYNYQNKTVSELKYAEEAENNEYNSEANAVAYTIENNLYVTTSNNPKIAVTSISDKNIVSGQAIARSEMGITKGTFWSPKGNYLAFYQKDESNVTNYPLVDVTTTPASVDNIKYPMNGMGSEIPKVGIYSMKNQSVLYLDIDTSDEHYLTNLSWSPDEKFVFLAEVNRGQNHMWFNMYDATSGKKMKTLFEEKNDKWVEPEHTAVFVPNSNSTFLWLSERDGFMNLYEYDIDNQSERQLTHFSWVIKEILGFDEKGKNVIVTGTGNDARETKAFKISLKNGKITILTSEPGTHSVQLSPNGNYIIDSYSSLDVPRVVKRKSVKNGDEVTIYISENPIKDYQLGTTELVTLKAKDGSDLYGRIIKPANFDASKKYPVLVYVYGGPHAQMVTNSWLGGSNLWMQWMAAEQDYVVFTLDNHGSAYRGFEFESAIHRQVGEVEMEDQLIGVDYLKSLPYVDGNRLAIHGWSYGGFMTNSLMLRHPGVFTTAVAGGPVTDWKYYEIMYGERYMDRWQDNEAGFEKAKIHNYVKNLDGKLLEIIGSVDPVVAPQHTMTLLQEFVKNKIQVDFFSYPMHPHNVRGVDRTHLIKKVLDYVILNNQ